MLALRTSKVFLFVEMIINCKEIDTELEIGIKANRRCEPNRLF